VDFFRTLLWAILINTALISLLPKMEMWQVGVIGGLVGLSVSLFATQYKK
jgi:hypothetical protein